MRLEIVFNFQSPSKRRFQCNNSGTGEPSWPTGDFQSPSKRRFQCNLSFFLILQEYICTFSLLVSGDFNVTSSDKGELVLDPYIFQSPSKRRFQCNKLIEPWIERLAKSFQSPSKRRFQCNLLRTLVRQGELRPFSLLVSGDFNVTGIYPDCSFQKRAFQSPSKRRFQCN